MAKTSTAGAALRLIIRAAVLSQTASPTKHLCTAPSYDKFESLRGLLKSLWSSRRNSGSLKCYTSSSSIVSGSKFAWGSAIGGSIVIGSICPRPHIAYAMDGFDILEDDRHLGLSDASDADEVRRNISLIARKVMLPFVLLVTVLMNLDHPVILATKVILFLLGTKPSPLSIYISIEGLQRQCIREQPIYLRFKSLYARKVEVEDYALMCLGRVELNDQKFTLVGILGNWWVLPSFTVFKDKVLKHIRN